jgi:8-oxo-dGTP diphosphatase
MASAGDVDEVRAAGGLVVRGARLAVVHRPRYDDWSLPKGKLDEGESWETAALREVAEETGLRCELLEELPAVLYADRRGRPKRVRYWRMAVVDEEAFVPGAEIDELRWLDRDAALATLTYVHDRDLVADSL